MKEQEEAERILKMFLTEIYPDSLISGFVSDRNKELAKQCAILHVQGIIDTYIDIDPKLKYWQQVLEIIKNG
jgi:hypothetical protein